ncbi:attachment protein [Pseudomonas aeruginosa]|uniref:attachment protein n=1 Tax=Pseudomonas aeruginosa TaxID=287 RepID=UPI000C781407|nr:attachment protein [Pseudomonas aeruginosa]
MSNNARSGLGRLLPLLGLLVSLLWHSLASADFYQWKISIPGKPTAFFPSYTAACQYYFDNTSANWLKEINKLSYKEVQCNVSGTGGITWQTSATILTGDSCPPEQELDPADGACKPPPEECKEGELFPAKGPDSPVVTSGGRNYVGDGGAPSACYQSCEYGGNPSPASCYLVKGSTTTGFCNYILKGTGQNCGADSYTFAQTGDSLNPPDTPNTDPSDPNDPGCPPGWSWSGTTCVKTPTDPTDPTDPTTPGGDGGGDGNGTCDPAKENCSTGPEGPGGELKEPTPGTWDDAIATWEKKVEEAKKELKTKVKANVDQMKGAFDLNLAEGGGQLPCESMTIWGKSYSLCISDYAGQLSSLRVALLLMAALIAALILLKD